MNQRILREWFFTFLEMLASLKLVNCIKLDKKADVLADEDLELTTVTVNQEGLKSTIMN